jgi:hypothetical protein
MYGFFIMCLLVRLKVVKILTLTQVLPCFMCLWAIKNSFLKSIEQTTTLQGNIETGMDLWNRAVGMRFTIK